MLMMIDKPSSYTSYDIIRKLKRLYPKTKIWHSGTLDPLATWLLIIWLWPDTKKLTAIQWQDKTYIASIDFSRDSDTRDIDYHNWMKQYEFDSKGIWKNWLFVKKPSIKQLQILLDKLIPNYNLPLTPFSAKKVNWKKLYKDAFAGKQEIRSQIMTIYWYKIISYEFPWLEVELKVGSGTYIRSIAYRLGQEFNLWWVIKSLRRTTIWEYKLL